MDAKQHKYESMPLDDRDDRSSTEVESLMEVEKQWEIEDMQRPRRSKASRVSSVLNSYRWLIDTSLLLVILALVVRSQYQATPLPYDFGGDITGVGPQCKFICTSRRCTI
jgi:hypothetical protein